MKVYEALAKQLEQAEESDGPAGVLLNLRLEGGGARELHFVAQPVQELDFHRGLIDLARKVQQERFHRKPVLAERRFVAHVRDRLIGVPADFGLGDVDAALGKLLFVRGEVQGGDSLFAADADSLDDGPVHRKGPAEQPASGADAALRKQVADAAARNPLALDFDRRQDLGPESLLTAEFGEQRDVTRLAMTEAEVRADHDPQ